MKELLKAKMDSLLEQRIVVRNKLQELTFQVIQPNDGNVPEWVRELHRSYCEQSQKLTEEIEKLLGKEE